jgi:metal-responsive CopG/Arc/MetJ family transcriptional regulator
VIHWKGENMAKTMERLMVSIPTEVKSEIDAVKQQDFYDKPYAELYRHIIRMGLTKMRETAENQRNPTKQLV